MLALQVLGSWERVFAFVRKGGSPAPLFTQSTRARAVIAQFTVSNNSDFKLRTTAYLLTFSPSGFERLAFWEAAKVLWEQEVLRLVPLFSLVFSLSPLAPDKSIIIALGLFAGE